MANVQMNPQNRAMLHKQMGLPQSRTISMGDLMRQKSKAKPVAKKQAKPAKDEDEY